MENKKYEENKRFAIISENKGDLELKVIGNKKEFDEYNKYLEKNNKIPELYTEISTQKTPYQIVSDFQKHVPERGFIKPPIDKNGSASMIYLGREYEDKFSFKESFLYYMTNYNEELKSF